jgi:membrane fusion protein (multidrug efflux system)
MKSLIPSYRSARWHRAAAVLLPSIIIVALGGVGCRRGASTQAAAPAPQEVGVITVTPKAVALTRELPGRTSAFRVAEVRARVSGIVQKRLFVEGSDVSEGQILYQIDPAPYQAALDGAKGTLARAEASAAIARLQATRYQSLIDSKAISQQDYDNALAAMKANDADVIAAKAAVEAAEINLGYTQITSPVTGRVGRSEVTEGAYVQQGQATLLATVQELDQMYVDLTQSNNELLRLKRAMASGKLQAVSANEAKVRLILEDDSVYAHDGIAQFTDVSVDPATGSILLRALFSNPNVELLPGMFVRAQFVEAANPAALLVPQSAVAHNTHGEATALVVGPDNQVELRTITTERSVGNQWLVTDGLAPGDRVIVEGVQRVRPGATVKPVAKDIARSDSTRVAAVH